MTIWFGLASGLVAFLLTPFVAKASVRLGIVDVPNVPRKIHTKPTPLLGGVAIFCSVALITALVLWRFDVLTVGEITSRHYVGVGIAALILLVGGILDDHYHLPPYVQIIAPALAAIAAIVGGVGIEKMTNPFGGVIFLETQTYGWFVWPGDVLVFLWLMGIMFTTKLLDGLDGLVTSVGSVGTLMIVLLASSAMFFQPDVAVFASIILGALLGFIVWNLYPATIFLGESGALLIGFFLGVLAIISGGKIATLLLVMGVPLLDVVWVIGRRLVSRVPVTRGDRAHLHYRLFDMGWSQNHVVALYTCVAVSFGILTLVLSSFAKLIALAILTILMCAGVLMITLKQRKRR